LRAKLDTVIRSLSANHACMKTLYSVANDARMRADIVNQPSVEVSELAAE